MSNPQLPIPRAIGLDGRPMQRHDSAADGVSSRPRMRFREISPVMALDSLKSTICPACGQKKKSRHTFCLFCYTHLPTRIKERLYLKIGKGYEAAMRDAMNNMHCEGFFTAHPQLSRDYETDAGNNEPPAFRPPPAAGHQFQFGDEVA